MYRRNTAGHVLKQVTVGEGQKGVHLFYSLCFYRYLKFTKVKYSKWILLQFLMLNLPTYSHRKNALKFFILLSITLKR